MIDGAMAASAAAWGSAMKPAMDKSCLRGNGDGVGNGSGVSVGNGNSTSKSPERKPQKEMKRSRSPSPVEKEYKKKKQVGKIRVEVKTRCHAREILAQRINHPESPAPFTDIVDIEKEALDRLPLYDTNQTSRRLIVASTAKEGERAMAELWADLGLVNDGGIGSGGDGVYRFIGFDTETKPNHTKGVTNPVALIQIATATTAYLFRLAFQNQKDVYGAMTESLMDLLNDHRIIKVGVSVTGDGEELNEIYHNCCNMSTFLELGYLVKLRWRQQIKRKGLKNLTGTLLGKNLSKAQQMKNWAQPKLTEAMKNYASNDAHVGLDLLCAIVGFPGADGHVRRY